MQKLNQQPDICPYFSPEFKVIPQYIIMKEGECMELNNRTTSFFIFILSGEITISFEQYTNPDRSRGLGDVYKRQLIGPCWKMKCFFCLKTTVLNGKLLRKQC